MSHNGTATARIVVLGLGNLIRSDDGLGVHAVQLLAGDPRVPDGVQIVLGETQGLSLLPLIEDATHVLALDAVNTGAAPGTVMRFDLSQLEPLPGNPSVHQLGFADLLEALRWLDKAEKRMVLLGMQPEQTGWGDKLSAPIQDALPQMVDTALQDLQRWAAQSVAN